MAGTATSPAAPAAPPTPPTPPAPPTPPPAAPGAPSAPTPEGDPNLAMSKLVARSREKATKPPETTPSTPPETPPSAPTEPPKPPDGPAPKLTNLLGKALKFTDKPGEPPPATPPATPPVTPPAAAAPPAEPPPAPAKKKATKKAAPVIDTAAIVRDAATAAATAVATAMPKAAPAADPAEALLESDRRDYEIAQHLAKMDPRFKDAPKLILEHVRKADEYAAQWERTNPGKVFDPKAEEHNDFYEQLATPWTQEQFQDAAIDLRAEQKAEEKAAKLRGEQSKEMVEVRRDQAAVELAPAVEREFGKSVEVLAEMVGPDVKKTLTTGGWEALEKEDPVATQVLATTLHQLHPFIEAAIQIDEPKRRVPLDLNLQAHAQWNRVVTVGEQNLAGEVLDGKMFARRADYVKMSPEQQAAHWYLTTDMIIQGALDFAGKEAKRLTEEGKAKLDKMGYKRAAAAPATPPPATPPTQPPPATPPAPPATGADKPISPSTSSGSKIDHSQDAPKSQQGALIGEISKILFRK